MQKIHSMHRRFGAVALAMSVAILSGCMTAPAAVSGAAAKAAQRCEGVTEINGKPVPGRREKLVDVVHMLDEVATDAGGTKHVLVERGTRKAGTRAVIHMHDHGGVTCILKGEMTIFMQGREPKTYPAGQCYYMPSGVVMAASNLGPQDVDLIDSFTLPPGAEPMTMCEPGYPSLNQ